MSNALFKQTARVVAAVVLAMSLTACATHGVTTNGPMRAPGPIAEMKVEYNPFLPSQIELIKAVRPGGTITQQDKQDSIARVQGLNELFRSGFKERFPAEAAAHDLHVAGPATKVSTLKVAVTSVQARCNDIGCATSFLVSADLIDADGVPVWNFFATVSQSTSSWATGDVFASFSNTLLAAMKQDRVLAR